MRGSAGRLDGPRGGRRALLGFYATYMAYRNLKSIVPLLRPDAHFDRQLADLDRDLFPGNDPAALLHRCSAPGSHPRPLGRYVAFIVFLPLTIGLALVFSRDLQRGAALHDGAVDQLGARAPRATSCCRRWGRSTSSRAPSRTCPPPRSRACRASCSTSGSPSSRDPAAATPQSIAAFASLHISMSFTAALAAHLLGLGRRLKIALWMWFARDHGGTVYLGWHYVLDDVAGLADRRRRRSCSRARSPASTCVRCAAARRREPAPGAPATAYRS